MYGKANGLKVKCFSDYTDGDSIFVSQIKDCSVKREGKIKQQRYF